MLCIEKGLVTNKQDYKKLCLTEKEVDQAAKLIKSGIKDIGLAEYHDYIRAMDHIAGCPLCAKLVSARYQILRFGLMRYSRLPQK